MVQKHGKLAFTDEELIEQYNKTPYLGKLACYFDVPDVTLFKRASRLGLIFKNGGNKTPLLLQDILDGKHPQYQSNKLKIRLLKEGIFANKCNICGLTDWNNIPIVLHLDHINGNCHDHRLDNLRLLCPNCHSQTETWCGKNK